jgi:prolyl oligopeptidase
MHRRLPVFLLALCALLPCPWADAKEAPARRPDYPGTRKDDVVFDLHGQQIADPYRWLEDDDAEEVIAWDMAQNELLRAHLDAYPKREALRARLRAELELGGMPSLPSFEAGRRFYTYRPQVPDKVLEHAILYSTDADGKDEPTVVLDPNGWSEDGTASLEAWAVSPNGAYVAYRADREGSEETTLYVKDLRSGALLPDVITRTKHSPIVWTADSKGFFYKRHPDPESVPEGEAQYHVRVYHHELGTLPLDDRIVYGRGRPKLESGYVYRSTDRNHVLLIRGMPYKTFETFELEWCGGVPTLRPVVVGTETRTSVDRVANTYIFNSDKNTGNREVFTAQRTLTGEIGEWKKVPFPTGASGVIQDCWPVDARHLLCHAKIDVVSHMFVAPLGGPGMREIALPGPGTVGHVAIRPGTSEVWFSFQSYSRALTTYRCNLDDEDITLEVIDTLPTTVDLGGLVSTQASYPSKDGTQVPIFLLHHKDTKLDGTAPTVLYGYGGFRVGLYPYFSRSRAMWAELGGVLAVACLRGGDEFGEAWHQAGCLANKQNVFDDFIAAADWLVATGKAARERLAIQGGSNGGLLVATCINQRPDLAAAVICSVPLTDMLRFHRFQFAESWTKEYGNPDVPEECAWIQPYSPVHNVETGTAYPAILVTAGLKDGRVNAFHARKIVAAWQAATTSTDPILLRIDRKGGHGAANISRAYDTILDQWCFLFVEL